MRTYKRSPAIYYTNESRNCRQNYESTLPGVLSFIFASKLMSVAVAVLLGRQRLVGMAVSLPLAVFLVFLLGIVHFVNPTACIPGKIVFHPVKPPFTVS